VLEGRDFFFRLWPRVSHATAALQHPRISAGVAVQGLMLGRVCVLCLRIWRIFLSGGVCASVSHGWAVPLDVIKTRLQTDPDRCGAWGGGQSDSTVTLTLARASSSLVHDH
jgi:hypothetical protein